MAEPPEPRSIGHGAPPGETTGGAGSAAAARERNRLPGLGRWRAVGERWDVRTFNRGCAVLGLIVLGAMALARFHLSPTYMDFGQFYMDGLIAWRGEWDSLYPIPRPGSPKNAGDPAGSAMRPRYAELAWEHGVGDTMRFIQLPPDALLYAPLSLLSYPGSHLVWTLASILLGVGVAIQSGKVYEHIVGYPTRVAGVLTLWVASSPSMYQSIRMGQVSVLVGLLIGAAVLSLVARDEARGGAVLFLAALMKYASCILLPVVVAMRRWRTVAWALGCAAATLSLSVAITGIAPFRVWLREIAPTLLRSHDANANQSVYGFLIRLTGQLPLSPPLQIGVVAVGAAVLLIILALISTRRRVFWSSPANVFAACTALLAWVHVFSPIFWNHYYPYLFPLWGWLAWEGMQSRRLGVVVVAAMALAWVPVGVILRDARLQADLSVDVVRRFDITEGHTLPVVIPRKRLRIYPGSAIRG